MINKKKQGKKNRASGSAWELKVRKDLESKGWFVSKFMNNVECIKYNHPNGKDPENWGECKLIPAKRKYNPFRRALSVGTGFPDFICWKRKRFVVTIDCTQDISPSKSQADKIIHRVKEMMNNHAIILPNYCNIQLDCEIIGVEAKSNGYLDKQEKAKCKWLLDHKVFNKILIAKKKKEGRKIVPEYVDFKEKYVVSKSQEK